jgi:Zn finger protein HypA/HybF involved in hydrogenase expression
MHEYHLARSLVKSILEKTSSIKELNKITRIKIKLGDLKMVSKESLSEAFKEVSKGTLCDGVKLDVAEVKGDILLVENIEGEFIDS